MSLDLLKQQISLSSTIPRVSLPDGNIAKRTHERLMDYFYSFEQELEADEELGGQLVSFGNTTVFHILDIGYWGPDIITFEGLDEKGGKLKLIQNVNQLNVLLISVKRLDETKPARRIGFRSREDD
jgi:hypothetical protein